jgi:hypothetical protein
MCRISGDLGGLGQHRRILRTKNLGAKTHRSIDLRLNESALALPGPAQAVEQLG